MDSKATFLSPMPPLRGRPLKLYLSTTKEFVGCLMAQNNVEGHEQVVYYLSKVLNLEETRYTPIESFVWPYTLHVRN